MHLEILKCASTGWHLPRSQCWRSNGWSWLFWHSADHHHRAHDQGNGLWLGSSHDIHPGGHCLQCGFGNPQLWQCWTFDHWAGFSRICNGWYVPRPRKNLRFMGKMLTAIADIHVLLSGSVLEEDLHVTGCHGPLCKPSYELSADHGYSKCRCGKELLLITVGPDRQPSMQFIGSN